MERSMTDPFDLPGQSQEDAARPYRVVDSRNQGWHPSSDGGGGTVWAADYGFMRDLENRSYEDLEATRGPLRPVEPITDADEAELRDLFTTAGRKTITSLAAALEQVFHELRESAGPEGWQSPGSYEYATRTLKAGREGSWESELLIHIVMFGNELNLATGRGDVGDRRAAGPSKRVNASVRDQLAAILHQWVTGPGRFTEVAETLASVVSRYADETGGRDGWRMIADQWLQPRGLAQETFSVCYRLFYSLSEHLDTSLF
jgi:hypothetical protein